MKTLGICLTLAFSFAVQIHAQATHITPPAEQFGFEPGTDRKLADWTQLVAYYQKVAAESDRVRFEELGKTMEGRPFVMLTISAPENLAHLAEYKEIATKLSDPRTTSPDEAKTLIAKGKTVMILTFNIHSTEIASSQTAASFVYRMASSNEPDVATVLKNTILLLIPSQNPDGEQLVVDWYKKTLGTPAEGSNPPVLYAKYVGHDDNRDWVGLTQLETQHTAKVINEWHPQILYDLHQQGADAPRLYLPPWVDPIDPNVDPLLVYSMNALGVRTAHDVASTGKTGILVHGVYDFWSPLRDYIALRNGLRILTESASAALATPLDVPFEKLGTGIGYDAKVAAWNYPAPWMGGTWHMSDICAYQMDALMSLTKSAADDRMQFLSDFYQVSEHAVHPKTGPYAYVVPPDQVDPAMVVKLVDTLRMGGVEVGQATAAFEAGGVHYAAGTYIILLNQPYRNYAKTVLERQKYPDIREYPGGPPQRPYDVAGSTLPLFYGLNVAAVETSFDVPMKSVDVAQPVVGKVEGGKVERRGSYLLDDTSNRSLYALFSLLGEGVKAYRLTAEGYSAGTILIPAQPGLSPKLETAASKFGVTFKAATEPVRGNALLVKAPRVGLYKSWSAALDEGWTRFVFESNGIPYKTLVDADIRKGNLIDQFDAIILPDNPPAAILTGRAGEGRGGSEENRLRLPQVPEEYRGGLGPEGAAALQAFVQAGGTIIANNKAAGVYARKDNPDFSNALNGIASKDFYCPGSILEVNVDTKNPVAFGSTPTVSIFFETGPTFKLSGQAKSILLYPNDHPLLSGWILGGKYLEGTSAAAEVPDGKGKIIAFGFLPMYRGLSEVTYKFLLNAMLYSTSTPASIN